MKRKIILRLSYLIVFLTVFRSCHNEDFASRETETHRNNAKFFLHSGQNGAAARSGADYIAILEAYNREKDFLSSMPDQQGMPIWEKMQVVDTETATGLMIPLSHDHETMSSLLFATLDGENRVTGVTNYDNKLLESIVNDQSISKTNRERLFYTFMYMDNKTFGNEHFTGIPKDLFIGDKSDGDHSVVWMRDFSPVKTAGSESGKIIIMETCVLVLHCTHHGTGACDAVNGCTACGHTECSYQVIITGEYDPFPSTPGGGGGGCSDCGGGGGTPGPEPPKDPCALTTVFYRIRPGCLGSGSDIDFPGPDDPCEKTKALLDNPDVQDKLDSLKNKSLSKGEIGFKTKKDGLVTPYISGGKHEVDMGVKAGYQGGYHNHTPAGIPMHSPPDIDNNLLAFARAQPVGEHKNAYFGMIVKKVCTGCPSGYRIYHYVIRFNGTYNDALKSFSQEEINELNNNYSEKYGDLIDSTSIYGNTYIDSTGNLTNEGLEKLFFDTLKAMNLSDKIILQRIEEDGTVNNIVINSAGTHTTEIPCP